MEGSKKEPARAKKFRELMERRLHAEGWDNIRQFAMRSGVPFSVETARRIFNGSPDKQIEPATIAICCRYLGMKSDEIRAILQDYTEDKEIWRLIGSDGEELSPVELSVLTATRMIMKKSPSSIGKLAEYLDTLGKSVGVNVASHVEGLRRGGLRTVNGDWP